MEKAPSRSVCVPLVVPSTITVAPGNGWEFSSRTIPFTVFISSPFGCCGAGIAGAKAASRKKKHAETAVLRNTLILQFD